MRQLRYSMVYDVTIIIVGLMGGDVVAGRSDHVGCTYTHVGHIRDPTKVALGAKMNEVEDAGRRDVDRQKIRPRRRRPARDLKH